MNFFYCIQFPMREDSKQQGSTAADKCSFQPLETLLHRMEDLIQKNSKLLEKKIDSFGENLSERVGKVESEIVELTKFVRMKQTEEKTSACVHKVPGPSTDNSVPSRQPDTHDPTPPIITLSSLVREKCNKVDKAVKIEEDSALHSSSSKDDEIFQQRLKEILQEKVINPKGVPHLIDEVCICFLYLHLVHTVVG